MRWVWISCLALALAPSVAAAASPNENYNVKMLSFDMWCQETARYSPDRCDAHTPDDQAEFEIYRASVERYEIPWLKRQQAEREANDRISRDVQPHPVGR